MSLNVNINIFACQKSDLLYENGIQRNSKGMQIERDTSCDLKKIISV